MATDTFRKYHYYKILEISRKATQQEIDASYRRLANQNHPDKNPNPNAHELFKKINQAYQVLGNSKLRVEYDNSQAECPDCWTYEVIQTAFPYWRCRRCGCQFNPAAPSEIKRFHQSAIPEKLRKKLELFSSTQCSSCRRFYTQPFLCIQDKLTSSCRYIDELNQQEREEKLENEKWHWRISDMLNQSVEHELMTRCRNPQCGALNPNPKTSNCWRCKQNTLRCPSCEAAPFLSYDLVTDKWRCINNSCRKTFAFLQPKKIQPRPELKLSEEVCPLDKTNLYFDPLVLLWKCKVCGRTYTNQELHQKPRQSDKINNQKKSGEENSAHPISQKNKREHPSFWEDLRRMVVGQQSKPANTSKQNPNKNVENVYTSLCPICAKRNKPTCLYGKNPNVKDCLYFKAQTNNPE